LPHHLTQRGNRDGRIFFEADFRLYKDWLAQFVPALRRRLSGLLPAWRPRFQSAIGRLGCIVTPCKRGRPKAMRVSEKVKDGPVTVIAVTVIVSP
jgi:hypothetical protein